MLHAAANNNGCCTCPYYFKAAALITNCKAHAYVPHIHTYIICCRIQLWQTLGSLSQALNGMSK